MKLSYLYTILLVFFTLLIFTFCSKKQNEDKTVLTQDSIKEEMSGEEYHEYIKRTIQPHLDELSRQIVEEGNEATYYKTRSYYSSEYRGEGLGYSMIMANKYNNAEAYLDVFLNLATYFSNVKKNRYPHVPEMDSKTRNLALYYLVRSHELKETNQSSAWIYEAFEGGKIPRHPSKYYLMEIIKEDAKIDTERKKK